MYMLFATMLCALSLPTLSASAATTKVKAPEDKVCVRENGKLHCNPTNKALKNEGKQLSKAGQAGDIETPKEKAVTAEEKKTE